MALSASAGKWRLLYGNTKVYTFTNNSGGTLTAGTLIRHSSGTFAACGDANTIGAHGVVVDDVADGEKGSLYVDGVFEVGCSASLNFAIGEEVYTLANGVVDKGSTNDKSVGVVAPHEDPANGALKLKVQLTSRFLDGAQVTHS